MILTRKIIDIVILVSLMVVSCQSVCPEEDYKVLPITGHSDDVSDSIGTSEVSPKPESVSAKETCECAASQRVAVTGEAYKTEQAIIKRDGKKYQITITLPIEVDGGESSKETTAEPIAVPTEQPINELSSPTETTNYEDFMVGEKDAEPQEQEEVKKEKVKVEKRKYKRDVGKKSASKKSSKRKNKEQGKKKSKK